MPGYVAGFSMGYSRVLWTFQSMLKQEESSFFLHGWSMMSKQISLEILWLLLLLTFETHWVLPEISCKP